MTNIVSLIKCESYDQNLVDNAVKSAIDNLGGINKFVKKDDLVVLKVNLVAKASPDKATTTHPSIVEAVGKLIRSVGGRVVIADSGGCAYTEGAMMPIYRASGMMEVVERNGFEINSNYDSYNVEMPDAKVGKKFPILDILQQADVIFNLCKLKTHSFTGLSNAVKNMFGAIPGLTKVEMHGKYRTLATFGDFLYDIIQYFGDKLVLNISDAIVGMEGPGPTSGTPRELRAVIASTNPLACDIVGARLMNLDPNKLPTVLTGITRGWLADTNVEIVGDDIDNLIVRDYVTVQANEYTPFATSMPRWMQPIVHRLSTRRPYVNRRKCKGCKKCYNHCPVGAITMVESKRGGPAKAKFDYSKCIRCFCCQELCPFQLVKVKSGIFYRFIHRKDKRNKQQQKS